MRRRWSGHGFKAAQDFSANPGSPSDCRGLPFSGRKITRKAHFSDDFGKRCASFTA
jgi:hypothetical protein